jgi:hypothetical protein
MPNRRQILRGVGGALTVVLGGLQIACTPEEAARIESAELSDAQLLTLVAITRHLFPHDHLDPTVYRDAVLKFVEALHKDADRRTMIVAGIDALHSDSNWLDLTAEEQIATLVAIEDSAFFSAVRAATLGSVYGDEKTWQMLGYGGDASRFGGYVERGFNDIDWLPDATPAAEAD